MNLNSEAEAELAVERLMGKMENWILQQPEALLIWAQPRTTRKRIGQVIADTMTRIPTRDTKDIEYNRSQRRRIMEAMRKENRDWWKGIDV